MKLLSFNLEDNNESANVRFEKSLNNKVKQLGNKLNPYLQNYVVHLFLPLIS